MLCVISRWDRTNSPESTCGRTRRRETSWRSRITNSDHIMHMMLKKHLLANISAETFYQYPDGHRPGIPLACGDGNIQYGILSRQNAGISEPAARFAQFLRERLQDR